MLALAAALESHSEHPLASSVLDFAQNTLVPKQEDEDGSPQQASAAGEGGGTLSPSSSPGKSSGRNRNTREWLRTAKDVEIRQGWPLTAA